MRAKYLDWCSARIAERFLKLTPDEIYELAQRSSEKSVESRDVASPSNAGARTPDPGAEPVGSFRHIVERVTERLAASIELPTFREWSASYRAQPARYDDELLGLWRESAD